MRCLTVLFSLIFSLPMTVLGKTKVLGSLADREPASAMEECVAKTLARPSFARGAACFGPAGAPVRLLYLHGSFPAPSPNELEKDNRRKLAELACRMKIRIALPLADGEKEGQKTWRPRGPLSCEEAEGRWRELRGLASVACGSPLAPGAGVIGFSDGGYLARALAHCCPAGLHAVSAVMTSGVCPGEGLLRANVSPRCPVLKVRNAVNDGAIHRDCHDPDYSEVLGFLNGARAAGADRSDVKDFSSEYCQPGRTPARHCLPPAREMEALFRKSLRRR